MTRCLPTIAALLLTLGAVATASAQAPGQLAAAPALSKGKAGAVRDGQAERSDFRQAGGQGGGKQGSAMFKEGGPQERVQGDKGKPGGPQYLRVTPADTLGGAKNQLDRRATPNAGVTGRPQTQQMPAAATLKDLPR